MIEVENYSEWYDWASGRPAMLEYYDRLLPDMGRLEEKGRLEFPADTDIGSTQDIRRILEGEARWEGREENEVEAELISYTLPIEYDRARDIRSPLSGSADIVDEELVKLFR